MDKVIYIKCEDCGDLLGGKGFESGLQDDIILKIHACFHALNKKFQIIKVLSWMTEDMKKRFDEQRSHFGMEVSGGYSPELTEAIELLESMKKEVNETKGN